MKKYCTVWTVQFPCVKLGPMSAREKVLDALQEILLEEGERAATMEQVAARAGVSKGGLLYHFPDKATMAQGLLDRVRHLLREDLKKMASAPEGPAAYYLRGSLLQDDPLDRLLLAVMKLPAAYEEAKSATYREVQEGWAQLIREEMCDGAIADAIILMGDGLYWNAAMSTEITGMANQEWEESRVQDLERVLEMLRAAARGKNSPS